MQLSSNAIFNSQNNYQRFVLVLTRIGIILTIAASLYLVSLMIFLFQIIASLLSMTLASEILLPTL